MAEKTIKISTGFSLPEVVNCIRKGEWKIPRFQREFVWEKKKVIELLDSMYKEFPIGSFFLWIPPEEYSHYYKDIPELKIQQDNRRFYTHFILDGQQRLTSLYVTHQGLTIDGYDYSNICFDLDTERFNTDPRDNERNLSVHQILNDDQYLQIYNSLLDERKKKFMKVKDRLKNYPFPVIIIEDKNIEEACKIFERINQGGKRLSIFDLVVAVTWDKDFELKKKIDEFNKEIQDNFGKIDYEIFSEALSLIIKGQCTKAFQLKLTPDDVKGKWEDVRKAIGKSLQFLRSNLQVRNYSYLPYRDVLALIAYYFYECYNQKVEVDKKFLEEWFWKVAFSNRYSGSSFNKIGGDRAYIFDKKLRNEEFNIGYDINITLDKIKNVNVGRKTALRNALILVMIQQQPLSFIDNSPIDIEKDPISTFNDSEKHHIFPRKFLTSIGIKEKKATDLLVNLCLIDSQLNKLISGTAPSEYFLKFDKQNHELKKSLNSHLIPADRDSAVWKDDYKLFIDQRAEIILRQVKKRIGDFTATIEEQMDTNPVLLIQKLEQAIRETVNNILYDSIGENWWEQEGVIPQDIKNYVADKIKKERANKPYIQKAEWETPLRRLEQINIMDYLKIILTNWNLFEDIFGSKKSLERYFDGFSTIRNQIDHIKTIDPTERKFGETAVEWLFKCIQDNQEKEAEEEIKTKTVSSLYINEIYEKLKNKIIGLDPEIVEKQNKYFNGFNKNNNFFNFAYIKFRKDRIKVGLLVKQDKFNDVKGISTDETKKKDKETRRIVFSVNSLEDIDYAIDLIKQAYEYNEWYLQNKGTKKSVKNDKRLDFWKGLLGVAKEKNADFRNLSPTGYHWIGKGGGKSGVSFNFVILNTYAGVEVYLDIGDKEVNKRRFDQLFKHKEGIEKIFGEALNWERLDSKRACRVSFRFEGVGLKNTGSLKDLQKNLVEKMMRLEKAFEQFIEQLS